MIINFIIICKLIIKVKLISKDLTDIIAQSRASSPRWAFCPNHEAVISKCANIDEDPTVKLELMLATRSI